MTAYRRGATLIELVLVLSLFSLVLGGLARFVAGHGRLARTQLEAARFAEAVRASRLILAGEVRTASAQDILAAGPDSVRVRAFRGGGGVCSVSGTQVEVRYHGYRQPDPTKDSVALVTALGEEYRAVEGVSDAGCGGEGLLLTLDAAPASDPAFILLFETGAYHLADGALRYRRGMSGRQPLVEAVLRPAAFQVANGSISFDAGPRPDSVPTVGRDAAVAMARLNPAEP